MTSRLSEQQIGTLKEKLEERYRQLREEIRQELLRSDGEKFIDLAGRVHDSGEASVADLLVDINLADIDRDVQEIRAIDGALLRIVEGTYGTCADCESSIGFERLQAYPTAKRCHRCQTLYEETYTRERPPKL